MNIKGFKDANGNIQKYDINALATPFTAEVGQVLVVESVDENGHPNGFSVVDQPSGVEITSSTPQKEGTVLTVNPNSEKINLYTSEEVDEKMAALGTVEITGGDPVVDNTVMTLNPDADDINLYTAEEIDSKVEEINSEINNLKEAGTVEVTSGEPTKESTVMTIDLNSEEVEIYTKEEIDAMFDALVNGNEVAY